MTPEEAVTVRSQVMKETLPELMEQLGDEVEHGGGLKDVKVTINEIRSALKTLEDACMRDGRWAHWMKPRKP